MPKFVVLDSYHRFMDSHNRNEATLVEESRQLWGREAHTLAWGLRVQAYPGENTTPQSYSFGSSVPACPSYGFRGKECVIREVYWRAGMPGVEEAKDGEYVFIAIDWVKRDNHG